MLAIQAIRRDNLRKLVAARGGPTSVSKALGYANGSFLAHLIGPNPSREISEKIARDMEAKLGLQLGTLDKCEAQAKKTSHPLAEAFEHLISELGEAGIAQIPEDKFLTLAGLLLQEYRERKEVRASMVERLVKLTAQ